jgi:hypothetical protein
MQSLETEILFFYQRRQVQQQHVAIREMTLLGGKWIGERQKWSGPDDDPIRLEIFHATPTPILHEANAMLSVDYPELRNSATQNQYYDLLPNLITFTLRNANNDFLGIATVRLPNNPTEGLLIIQMIIAEKFRGRLNGSLLLNVIEDYASKLSIGAIAVKILNYMPKDFFFNKGYKILSACIRSEETDFGSKLILFKHLPLYGTSGGVRRIKPRYTNRC